MFITSKHFSHWLIDGAELFLGSFIHDGYILELNVEDSFRRAEAAKNNRSVSLKLEVQN